MKVQELLSETAKALAAAKSQSPESEARWIVEDALGLSANELPLFFDKDVPENAREAAEHFIARRAAGEPLQYVLGHAAFRQLDLRVGPGVLVPRPETELLVDMILKLAPRNARICELGVGSGAISLATAQERPDLFVLGIELSPDALAYAEANRRKYGLENVSFILGNLLAALGNGEGFALIVANLPYVSEAEMRLLPDDVRLHEPRLALHGGEDGLDIISEAVRQASSRLVPGGQILLEMGETQGAALAEIVRKTGCFDDIRIVPDLAGKDRFVRAGKI